MRNFFPFQDWLSKYNKSFLLKDLIAGLTVGIILVPQGMAYAMIAGLPPVYGLYASVFPILVYLFLGTSRQLAVGPVAMDSLLVAAGLGTLAITGIENYIAIAIFLAFMVGAIQLLFGLFRMGFLVNFLSKPVISGFTSGAALIIMFSQIKHLLGADIEKSNKFHQLVLNVFDKLVETNIYDFAIGIIGILIIVLLKKVNRKIPSILLVVVLGILSVYFLELQHLGIKIVGEIPNGLPNFQVPDFSFQNVMDLWPIALTLALVGYLEAISIGKAIEEKNNEETIDANQELIALGSSNIVGSFFQSYPVTASFSRSAISGDVGGKTNLYALFSVITVVVTLLFLTPLFYFLPKAILASIIMVSVFGLIDFEYPRTLWKFRKDEFIVLVLTFLITLFIGIKEGVLIGVLFSLLLMVYRTSKPHFAVLGKVKGSEYYKNIERFGDEIEKREDLLILRFDSQLYFGNKSYFKSHLMKEVNAKGNGLKGVILNAEAVNYIDSTAANMLISVINELHDHDLRFYIAGAIGPTRDIIFSSGIIDALDKDFLFVRTKEAVAHFDDPANIPDFREKIAHQSKKLW
ncbi:SulP family inorganic anion transporter [Maribacter sp. HTCC2170]|uniref:SulP family inorganic anion transporter n=1 Tax=Maribacter sp. (strain HTCC2170 / KCCM 42371) TaxID=313603 RepID=UPI00006BD55F|nr:solute carrier family 26 protein [Maribacter sp. HTCC2170]EAR02051.1 sulfate transporter [Maribacter sp. HTCC2170]